MDIKFEDYVRNLRANAQSGVLLGNRLEQCAPIPTMNADQRRCLRAVLGVVGEIREVQTERERFAPQKLRPTLDPCTNAWSALHGGLASKARLPAEISKDGPAAAAVLGSLLPDGVAFMQLPAERAWTEADRLVGRMEKEELDREIGRLIGDEFVTLVVQTTAALGAAVGAAKGARPPTNGSAMSEVLAKFGRAVGAYGRSMAAAVDESDEKSVAWFLAAMAPIDQHRAAIARGGSVEEEEEDPISPAQPVTPVAPVVTPVAPVVTPVAPVSPDPEPVR